MAFPSAYASGTQTCTVGTEHYVSSPNVAGTFTFVIDTINLADGDVLEVRCYQMVLTGGTTRVVYFTAYYGAQPTDDLIKVSVPVSNELTDTNAVRFSVKQTFGTGRNVPYKILQHA